MADPVKSAARWKAKYKVERVKDTLNDLREGMAVRYEAAMTDSAPWKARSRKSSTPTGFRPRSMYRTSTSAGSFTN